MLGIAWSSTAVQLVSAARGPEDNGKCWATCERIVWSGDGGVHEHACEGSAVRAGGGRKLQQPPAAWWDSPPPPSPSPPPPPPPPPPAAAEQSGLKPDWCALCLPFRILLVTVFARCWPDVKCLSDLPDEISCSLADMHCLDDICDSTGGAPATDGPRPPERQS